MAEEICSNALQAKKCLQEEIERGFLRRAMTLCQDTDYIVRINMCDGLHRLAAAVGLDVTVSTILPEILELMKDEEALVRVSATNSLVAGMTAAQKPYTSQLAEESHFKFWLMKVEQALAQVSATNCHKPCTSGLAGLFDFVFWEST